MRNLNVKLLLLFSFIVFFASEGVLAQTYNDGPIQLRIRVREIGTYFDATDNGTFGLAPDELRYDIWARGNFDVGALGWQGGTCLQSNFSPSASGTNSADFNYIMFDHIYTGAQVPQFFDLRLNAWEDDSPDSFLGIGCGGSDCVFDASFCCGGTIPIIGGCVLNEGDDFHCDAQPFQTNLNYRLGDPCQWYDFGFVTMIPGACANDVYKPHIQSYWRYTSGTGCGDQIALGSFNGSSVLHYNSNACYGNNWPNSPGNDVFYSIVVTQPMGVNISTCGGSNFDTYLYLLDQNCSTILASNDNACGSASEITTTICTPGTYTIVVDGASAGAMGTFTLTVTDNPSILADFTTATTPVHCNGGNDGTASVTVTQGLSPFTYNWGPGNLGTTPSISSLAAGTYSVTVTDVNGCEKVKTVTVTEPTAIVANITPVNPICHNGNNGSISISASGGIPPYLYSVDAGNTYQASSNFPNLGAGTYTLIVKDNNGCTDSIFNVTLTNPPASIVPNVVITNISCNSLSDGSITANPANGTAPYLFSLDNQPFVSTNSFTGLALGIHHLVIQDNIGCQVDTTFNISQPQVLTNSISAITAVSCFGGSDGSFTVAPNGGTAPYTYSIDGVNFQPSETFTGLSAGTYNLTVQDAHGCTSPNTVIITQPTLLVGSMLFKIDVSCHGLVDGLAVITASGGTGPYEYSLDNNFFYQSGAFSNLAGGTYTFYVRDNNGCTAQTNVTIVDPPAITATADVNNATCLGVTDGSVTVHASGGTPPYKFSINGGAFQNDSSFTNLTAGTFQFTVRDKNLCEEVFNFTVGFTTSITASIQINNVLCHGGSNGSITVTGSGGGAPYNYALNTGAFGASNSFTGLAAGNYTVHVRDNNGCLLDSAVTITEPAALNIDVVNIVNAACFNSSDGSITINVTGGTAPYSYAWSGGATGTTNPTNLAGGTYTVTVTDANSCTITKDIVVGQTPRIYIGIASTQNVSCAGGNDGYIDITVSGGTPPYSFVWSNTSTTEDQTHLVAGTYGVTVTDGNGCSLDTSVVLSEPPAITGTLTVNSNNVCAGSTDGTATISGSGGVPPYTYSINGVTFQTDTLFTGLGAGSYSGIIKDATGCSFTTNSITITSGAALSVHYQDAQITLGDSILLEAMLTPTTFRVSQVTWTPTDGLACPTCLNTEASPRQTTTYNVVVTDSGGCSATTNVTVTVDDNFRVLVPNVFSPNGDGNNDYFSFYAFGTEKIEVHIFNRWGALVYYNPNQLPRANGWDGNFKGKEAQAGTYVYVLDILFANGELRQQTGSITLLR